jgi:hypothetical protein
MFPITTKSGSVCYGAKESIVKLANANHNIVAIITTPELAYLVDANKELVVND